MTDTFEEACKKADQAIATPKEADDWLAVFAKRSSEALAAKAAEKQQQPAPNKDAVVDALARKDAAEYDQVRGAVSETLGLRVGTLDDLVTARREAVAATSDDNNPAHWAIVPSSDPVDGAELLESIRAVFRRHIMLPPWADVALPLWVLHAWTHDRCEVSPILCLTSPTMRCGKTSVMIILTYLTPRSDLASNISKASIYRHITAVHPTLLIDEGDTFLTDDNEMRGILNSGHVKAAATVVRQVEENGEIVSRRFSTWAPKAIALIKRLADTLRDRSITILLMRKPPGVLVERLRKRDTDEFKRLREQAARWAADNGSRLIDAEPQVPDTLDDRASDNWRPLLAIADQVGGDWPELARKAAIEISGAQDDSGSVNVTLLSHLWTVYAGADEMRSVDIVTALVANAEWPWATWGKNGKPLSQHQLGRLLSAFGLSSETVHIPGLPDAKGYKRAHLVPLWEAYCSVRTPSPGPDSFSKRPTVQTPVESAQVGDFQSVLNGVSDTLKNGNLSYSHAGLDAWTLQKAESVGDGASDQAEPPPLIPADQHPNTPTPPSPRRTCACCGKDDPSPNLVSVDGLIVRLHQSCEAAYLAQLDLRRSS